MLILKKMNVEFNQFIGVLNDEYLAHVCYFYNCRFFLHNSYIFLILLIGLPLKIDTFFYVCYFKTGLLSYLQMALSWNLVSLRHLSSFHQESHLNRGSLIQTMCSALNSF